MRRLHGEHEGLAGASMSKIAMSIIIPAYRAHKFIHQCLGSIVEQSRLDGARDYEILLGIDGCEKTLNKVKTIRHAYPGLRVFWFPQNVGPYVVRNTLAYEAIGDNIIFFDADDMMLSGLVDYCDKALADHPVARFRFYDFDGEKKRLKSGCASGAFAIRRTTFYALGGFQGWVCAADREFIQRSARFGVLSVESHDPLFLRRQHRKNLTFRKDTGMTSELREKYHQQISRSVSSRYIHPKTAHFEVIEP